MRKRLLFDVACENPRCSYVGEKLAGNFVKDGRNKLKGGRKVQVLRCDCGQHIPLTPSSQKGLHHRPETRAKQIAAQDSANPDGQPIEVTIDGSDGLTLYHIARGLTINQVARLFVRTLVPDSEYRQLGPEGLVEGMRSPYDVGGWENWLKLYPILAEGRRQFLISLPKPKTRVSRTRLKTEKRKVTLRVQRAVQFPDQARQTLMPYMSGPEVRVLTRTGYRKLCLSLKRPYSAEAYNRLRRAIVQPLTGKEVEQNLFHRYKNLAESAA